RAVIKKTRALTDKPFAVNLFAPEEHHAKEDQIEQARIAVQASCPELNFTIPAIKAPFSPSFEAQMNILLEEKLPVFSFTFGIPSREWIDAFKKIDSKLIGTAT